ncbi:MAG: hypothetical protein R2715_07330 [Ilumatobacteraceae bacterium]
MQATFSVGIFDARLSGWIATGPARLANRNVSLVPGGIPEDARIGDFEFRADDVSLGIAGFELGADVTIASRGGRFTTVEASLVLGLSGAASAEIRVGADLDSSSELRLTGTGNVSLAGRTFVGAEFTALVSRWRTSISARAITSVPDLGSVTVTGGFVREPGEGTYFTLSGTSTVAPAGLSIGAASFVVARVSKASGTDDRGTLRSMMGSVRPVTA